jgi:hypothetical protein
MTRAKFLDLVIEKVVVAAFIGAASLAVLYSYNLYSRAFESAGEQSRAFSNFAVKTRDDILLASAQLRSLLVGTYYQAIDNKTEPVADIYGRFAHLDSAINILANLRTGSQQKSTGAGPFQGAYADAKSMRDKFEGLINTYDRSQKRLKLTESFEKSLAAIDQSQGRFVADFSREMASVMAEEFQEFHRRYFDNVPPWGRPIVLPILAGAALILALLAYALLPKAEKNIEFID